MSSLGLVCFISCLIGTFSTANAADTCMAKWMILAGISSDDANSYDDRLELVKADEKSFDKINPRLYGILLDRSPSHSAQFLECMRRETARCQEASVCANGGVCRHQFATSTFACDCKEGFGGKFCNVRSREPSTCPPSSVLLPSGPSWLNLNVTRAPINANIPVRFALSDFGDLYNPSFTPMFTCKLSKDDQQRTSPPVPVIALKDGLTGRVFFAVDCVLPTWTMSSVATVSQKIDVSLVFQGERTVLFAGQDGGDKLLFYVGWESFSSGMNNNILVKGGGFSTSSYYACEFVGELLGSPLQVTSKPSLALSNSLIQCDVPLWNFTSDKRAIVPTQLKVWLMDPLANSRDTNLPLLGTKDVDDKYIFDRCTDGVSDGAETDTDCGKVCPNRCPSGAACLEDSDCVEGSQCISHSGGNKMCLYFVGKTQKYPADNCTSVSPGVEGLAWIKWNNTVVQVYCDKRKVSLGGDGKNPSSAGVSCASVNMYFRDEHSSSSSAVIWINPTMSARPSDVYQIYCDFNIACGPGISGGWSLVYSSRDDQSGNNNMQKGTRHSAVITTLHPGNANKKLAYDVLSALSSNAKPFTQVMLTGYSDYRSPGALVKMCFNNTAQSGQATFMSFIDWGIGRDTSPGCYGSSYHGTELQTNYPIILSWENYAFVAGYGQIACGWIAEVWNEIDTQGGHLLAPSLWPTRAESYSQQSASAGACDNHGLFHIFVR